MKIHSWILAVALALSLGGAATAQSVGGKRSTSAVTAQGTKPAPKSSAAKKPAATKAGEVSLGSAARRALLAGKGAAGKAKSKTPGKASEKDAKPKRRS